jgi:ATP-dependent Lhr-like helicase
MTTTWPGSGSDPACGPPSGDGSASDAFRRFHPDVQRWIYDSGWEHLRDIQERAAPGILAGDHDMILSAGTASGKSEAAWLPICSVLRRTLDAGHRPHGVQAVVVSPLKALINDQYERLNAVCERVRLPVHRWHGDVPGNRKALVLREPSGLLLITPESIEALFVRQGFQIGRLFGGLRYIVIDELHSFIGTPRGAQLQSLLHRIELRAGRRVPRIALSATLGDLAAAAEYLRPGSGDQVEVVTADTDADAEVRLQLRGYVIPSPPPAAPPPAAPPPAAPPPVPPHTAQIADHVFATLRSGDNLVFANSRASVEQYADLLAQRAAAAGCRTEFLAHHGSLARDLREDVEARLRDPSRQVTAICTSTLELGIDVGSVDAVAQLGAPLTVTGLRQRLGRSGRRAGRPAVLRV